MLRADPFFIRLIAGLLKPKHKILGVDVAGQVEAVGKDVKQFKIGDEVFGDTSGIGGGAFAEFVTAGENTLALKPTSVTYEEAASIPMAAVTALQGLRDKGNIQSGQKVLINGASGGVGTFAVQIAKSLGAEVTAVCSTRNLEMADSIGADHVIDYTKEDFTKSEQRYDLILAANGYHSIFDYMRALNPEGVFVMSGGSMIQFYQFVFLGSWISMFRSKKLCNYVAQPNQKDLAFITELFEAGKIKPVIDKVYPLEMIRDAHAYVEAGHKKGNVVIKI